MAKSSNSFFGWLGRQIGSVKGAVQKDVTPPAVLFRRETVQEVDLPDRPDEKLRRTVVDEVLRDPRRQLNEERSE